MNIWYRLLILVLRIIQRSLSLQSFKIPRILSWQSPAQVLIGFAGETRYNKYLIQVNKYVLIWFREFFHCNSRLKFSFINYSYVIEHYKIDIDRETLCFISRNCEGFLFFILFLSNWSSWCRTLQDEYLMQKIHFCFYPNLREFRSLQFLAPILIDFTVWNVMEWIFYITKKGYFDEISFIANL